MSINNITSTLHGSTYVRVLTLICDNVQQLHIFSTQSLFQVLPSFLSSLSRQVHGSLKLARKVDVEQIKKEERSEYPTMFLFRPKPPSSALLKKKKARPMVLVEVQYTLYLVRTVLAVDASVFGSCNLVEIWREKCGVFFGGHAGCPEG